LDFVTWQTNSSLATAVEGILRSD